MVTHIIALTKSHIYTPKAPKLNVFTWQHDRNTCPTSGGDKYNQYKGKKLLALRILENFKFGIRWALGNAMVWTHSYAATQQIPYCVPHAASSGNISKLYFPFNCLSWKQAQICLALSSPSGAAGLCTKTSTQAWLALHLLRCSGSIPCVYNHCISLLKRCAYTSGAWDAQGMEVSRSCTFSFNFCTWTELFTKQNYLGQADFSQQFFLEICIKLKWRPRNFCNLH